MTAETPQTGIPLSVAIKRCIFHLNLVFFLFFFLLGFWAVGGTWWNDMEWAIYVSVSHHPAWLSASTLSFSSILPSSPGNNNNFKRQWLQHHTQPSLQVGQRSTMWHPEAHSLEQRGQEKEKLQDSQWFANADSRSRPKWKERGGCDLLTTVVKKTFWNDGTTQEKVVWSGALFKKKLELHCWCLCASVNLVWTNQVCPSDGGRGESTTCWPKHVSPCWQCGLQCYQRSPVI